MSNAPIYVQFCAAVRAHALKLGYQEENKAQYVVFVHPTTDHKFAIQKTVTDLPRIETTLEVPIEAPEAVEAITQNGRMRTVLLPTPDTVLKAMTIGADPRTPKTLSRRQKGQKAAPALADLLAAHDLAPAEVEDETVAE